MFLYLSTIKTRVKLHARIPTTNIEDSGLLTYFDILRIISDQGSSLRSNNSTCT